MPTLRNKKQEKVPKYKVLTYEEKLNAIKLVENGVSIMVVARQFKVSRHTICGSFRFFIDHVIVLVIFIQSSTFSLFRHSMKIPLTRPLWASGIV